MTRSCTPARIALLILLAVFLWGCSADRRARYTVNSMKPMMENMTNATNRNGDVDLVRDAMPVSLVQLDGFIATAPDNDDLLLRAAEANSGYAFLFVQDTDKKRAAQLHKKGRDYALRVLKKNRAFRDALDGSNDEFLEALQTFEKSDVPALFFTTNSWMAYIGLSWQDNPRALVDITRVLAMMDRVIELDDTFNYGGIHALVGAYHASRPSQMGGNPDEAEHHFRKAMEISQSKFLLWHFLYAAYYAVQIQDRELYVRTLQDIASAPENLLPEKNFVNEAIKRKAQLWLTKTDELFNGHPLLKGHM